MFGVTRHLRVGMVFLTLLLLSSLPLQAAAVETAVDNRLFVETPKIIITEIQTNGGIFNQEFIELYNATDEAINLSPDPTDSSPIQSQWKLRFYGSSVMKNGVPSWQTAPSPYVYSLSGTIQPNEYFLVASNNHKQLNMVLPADQTYPKSNPMTDSGGAVELVEVPVSQTGSTSLTESTSLPLVHDQIFWLGSGVRGEGVLPAPPKFGSLQREPIEEGGYSNSDGSLPVFISAPEITPLTEWKPSVAPEPEEPENTEADPESYPETETPLLPVDNGGLLPPDITELLPNPVSPLKDETDEYIELFNPNPETFNLRGYTVQTGIATLHDFTITDDLLIPAGSYLALFSKDTGLVLANSGGQARLLDPSGVKLSETTPYAAAEEGSVWTLSSGSWQWSTSTTPGLANVLTLPVAKVAAVAKAPTKKATAKTTANKVKGTTKTKAAAKKKTKKAAKPKVAAVAQMSTKQPRTPIHKGVLVLVVAVAVLYAAYEYRHDLSNRFYRLRGHRRAGAVAR